MFITVMLIVVGVGVGFYLGRRPRMVERLILPTASGSDLNAQFARLLETCGFRIFTHLPLPGSPFDQGQLCIGSRTFVKPEREMSGWRIAYQLLQHAECCTGYYWWRLAQPLCREESFPNGLMDEIVYHPDAGLGPRVCAKCGRIERDHDGAHDGIGGLIGRAINIFPVLDALSRKDGEYADRARLEMLERERQSLTDRNALLDLEIAQLRTRLPQAIGDGPYRAALPAAPEPEVRTTGTIGKIA